MKKLFAFLTLFTSFSTLLCCAIPALLVFLGAGSLVASLFASFPFLGVLATYKAILFSITAIFLMLGFFFLKRNESCTLDLNRRAACQESKQWSRVILKIASILFFIGFFMAYLAKYFL